MKTILIIVGHIVVIALLYWAGTAWNDQIIQSQNKHTGLIAVFSAAWTIYVTALNLLYQRNQTFHLFVNRVWFRLFRSHTYWQPHITMELGVKINSSTQILDNIWQMLASEAHGVAQCKTLTQTTLVVALDELWVTRFRLDDNKLFMNFEQKLLVPSHLYDSYRQRLAKLVESITQLVKPDSIQCGLRVSFEAGENNPYYGLFVNRIKPDLLQNFQVVFRLDAKSSCRIEAGKEDVNIESKNMADLFEALKKVLSLEASPTKEST